MIALQHTFSLTPVPTSIKYARDEVSGTLLGWGLQACAEDLRLCVSELVTNALRHGEGLIEVHLAYRGPLLRCEVRDEGANQPRRRRASGAVNGGRGLQLVEGIVQEYGGAWGVSRHTARPGKAVYVEIPLPLKGGGTEPVLSTPCVVEELHE